jgi:outer membrane protein assembly factor BamB
MLTFSHFDDASHSSLKVSADQQTVYVGSNDFNLYAINSVDGTHRWNFSTGGKVISSPAEGQHQIFVGSCGVDKNLYALNKADGALIWKYTTDGVITGSVTVSEDQKTVYVTSLPSTPFFCLLTLSVSVANYLNYADVRISDDASHS